jgi:hypothetical protein
MTRKLLIPSLPQSPSSSLLESELPKLAAEAFLTASFTEGSFATGVSTTKLFHTASSVGGDFRLLDLDMTI